MDFTDQDDNSDVYGCDQVERKLNSCLQVVCVGELELKTHLKDARCLAMIS